MDPLPPAAAHKKLYAAGVAKSTSDMRIAPRTERDVCGCKHSVRLGVIALSPPKSEDVILQVCFCKGFGLQREGCGESSVEITLSEGSDGSYVYSAVSPPKLTGPSPEM
jgi:hypothetical protein